MIFAVCRNHFEQSSKHFDEYCRWNWSSETKSNVTMDDGGDMDDTLLQDVDDGGGDDDDEGFATELEEVSLMMETQNALQQFSIGLWWKIS